MTLFARLCRILTYKKRRYANGGTERKLAMLNIEQI
jgi:hypothetical protein